MEVDLRLESVHEGILATADVFAEATSECSRCLEPLKLPVEVDFQELFAYSASSEDDLIKLSENTTLFTRMFPEAKLEVVNALKAQGNVVAMLGDGFD